MPAAVPLIGAVAGAAVSSAGIAAGLGLAGFAATAFNSLAGYVVSTAINQLGSRAIGKKNKTEAFTAEAQGRSILLRSSVETHKLIYGRAKVSGPLVYAATTSDGEAPATGAKTNKFLHIIIPLAGHEVEEIGDVYFNDQIVTLDGSGFVTNAPYFNGASFARVAKFTGAADQAADTFMVNNVPNWTTDHRLRGIAFLYVRLEFSQDAFPQGIPNISAVVKGKKVYDPRTGLTEWTDNSALCVRDYLVNECDIASARIPDAVTIATANVCDEAVTLSTGGTQSRYTSNGVIDTGAARRDNLVSLLSAMAGEVVRVGSEVRIFAGAYESPVGSITDDILAGDMVIRGRTPRSDLVNTVRGTYVDPNKNYLPTDFPRVTNATYVAQDAGQEYVTDLDLPFTSHPEAAQRIAKVIMEKARQGITVEVPLMHHALTFSTWDTITVTQDHLGWTDKPFRIKSMKMGSVPNGAIQLTLQEESPESYDWDSGEANTGDAAPDTNLPSATTVQPPGTMTVTESLYVTRDGDGVKAKASLSWLESPDAFLLDYQAEYREITATAWTVIGRTDATEIVVEDVAPGTYDFRVKARNHLGVSSPYVTVRKAITGLLDPPAAPQNLTITRIGGLVVLRWDQSPDLDVRIGGKIVFRHSPDTGAAWNESTSIGNALPGSTTVAVLPLKAGAYLAKAVDSSGIFSVAASSVTTAQAAALAYANLTTLTEDPTFSGTLTDMIVDSGELKLAGTGLFDSIPDLDAVPNLDAFGGATVSGSYDFSGGMDLGSVKNVRLTGTVAAVITQVYDLIDSRSGLIDDWEWFDGSDAAEGDAILYARQTDDNPAGSPVWGAWHRLDSGEFRARAFEFKLEAMVSDPTYNISISQLSVTAEEVA